MIFHNAVCPLLCGDKSLIFWQAGDSCWNLVDGVLQRVQESSSAEVLVHVSLHISWLHICILLEKMLKKITNMFILQIQNRHHCELECLTLLCKPGYERDVAVYTKVV